jgi:hypothetical protein
MTSSWMRQRTPAGPHPLHGRGLKGVAGVSDGGARPTWLLSEGYRQGGGEVPDRHLEAELQVVVGVHGDWGLD